METGEVSLGQYRSEYEVETKPLTQEQLIQEFAKIMAMFEANGWDNITVSYDREAEQDEGHSRMLKHLTLIGLRDFFEGIQSGYIGLGECNLSLHSVDTDTSFVFTQERSLRRSSCDISVVDQIWTDWQALGYSPMKKVHTWYPVPSGGSFYMEWSSTTTLIGKIPK